MVAMHDALADGFENGTARRRRQTGQFAPRPGGEVLGPVPGVVETIALGKACPQRVAPPSVRLAQQLP